MKQSVVDKVAAVLSEADEIIDPTLIMTFITAILSIWKGCSSPAVAKAQIKAGGPVAYGHALQVVRQETELRGKYARRKAAELVEVGKKLTEEELEDMANDAKDAPDRPKGVFQFSWIVLLLLFIPSIASAQSGIFQIDVEQNRRLDVLEKKLDDVVNRLDSKPQPVAPASGVGSKFVKPSIQKALQASPAYEIVNGVRVHTSDAHLIHHGYSPSDFAGLTPDQKDRLHGAAHNGTPPQNAVATTNTKYATMATSSYVNVCNNGSCRRILRRFR